MKKLLRALFVCALMMVCVFALSSRAEAAVVDSGTCGDNLTWTLDDADTLTISGTGAMTSWSGNSSPWYDSSTIRAVIIEDGVTTIGSYAFCGCDSLTSVTIPDSVTTIGGYAFYDCTSLTSVHITDVGAWCNISFGTTESNPVFYAKKLYFNGELLTELIIPDSVTTIGKSAFAYCTSLTSITIPDSVTTIGNWAFYGCPNLTSVHITDIGAWCNISFCTTGSNPVVYAKKLYLNGELLTKLIIPNSVTTIGSYAFYNCDSLTSITIPDSVTTIGAWAFYSCDRLTSVIIGNGVTTIGEDAFYSCGNLTSVTIGNSCTTIGSGAFGHCIELKNVYYAGNQTQWNEIAIVGFNDNLTNATIHYNHRHDYSLFEPVTVQPTCTSSGYTEYTCVYGEKHREILLTLGHLKGKNTTVIAPTCTEAGYTLFNCVRCGTTLRIDPVAALGHDYTGPRETIQPTCEKNGYTGHGCTRCDLVRADTMIGELGHSVIVISAKDATCTEKGNTAGTQCDRCKTYFVRPSFSPATGHKYTNEQDITCNTCGLTRARITKQPVSVKAGKGQAAKVTFTASGKGLTYKWYFKNKGASTFSLTTSFTGNTYQIAAMDSARNGRQVYCVVTDKYGNTVQTNTVTLSMVAAPEVTKQPVSVKVCEGQVAKVTVKATGDGLTYRWYYKNPGSKNYTYTSTFTGSSYQVTMNDARNGRIILCRVYDKYGNVVQSKSVKLSMADPVKITKQPISVTVSKGETAKVTVKADGDGLTYKWYYKNKDGSAFKLTTSFKGSSYSVAMTTAKNARQVYCKITDKYGNSVKTRTVTLKMG